MKIIFGLGHPAHFHLFKNTINQLINSGNEIVIVINDKDILSHLLDEAGMPYRVLTRKGVKDTLFIKLKRTIKGIRETRRIIKDEKPDVLAGCINEIVFASLFTRIPVLFFAEDDFRYTWLQGILVYPFVTRIISPEPVDVGPFKYKKENYNGFQKLAYLHPLRFKPDRTKVNIKEEPYFIIRLVGMSAYHDIGQNGMDSSLVPEMIDILEKFGKVYVTSEKGLESNLHKYRLELNPSDIHHYMYYASMFISDSQSMTVEASLLGTPNIRISDFAGRVSVLEQLEKKYGLTAAFKPPERDRIFALIAEWTSDKELRNKFSIRREIMLKDMIDVAGFITGRILFYGNSEIHK
jgi:uncharacterized protein